MVGRKRRRAQAFQEDEAEEFEPEQAQVDDEKDQAQREQEVWDAVREERFESVLFVFPSSLCHWPCQVVEQLPLTLHRQLSLMKQLDEQAQSTPGHVSSLNRSDGCRDRLPPNALTNIAKLLWFAQTVGSEHIE